MKKIIVVSFLSVLACQFSSAQNEIFVPQVVTGGGYLTTFHLINLASTGPVIGEIEAVLDNGRPMWAFENNKPVSRWTDHVTFTVPALGQRSIFAFSDFPLQVGWAVIRSSAPLSVIVTLRLTKSGRLLTSTSILPDPLLLEFTSYALISPNSATGLALLNPSKAETARVSFKLIDKEGAPAGEKSITIQPRGKIAQFLNENELFTELKDFEGTLEVTSSIPLAVTVIRVDDTYWSTFRTFPSRSRELK